MDQKDRQIEELKQQIEDLSKRLCEANEANTAKETFLANMSHDIRTPMNAIVGMTSLAKKYIDEKPRVIDALNKIDAASTHLLSLINDILDMSRINSGKMEISMDEFSLPELINETYNIIRPQLEQKGHSWTLEADELETEDYFGDPLRIRQVLVNVLSNSVKYTPADGYISLSVKEKAQGSGERILSFICTDNGIGMSEDFVQRIFEPFERVNNSTISGIEGTGLGMSIVKKIVDAMNGTILIKSKQGEGTEVTVELPLKPVSEDPHAESLSGKRVLVIEANKKYREKYTGIFEETGVDFRLTGSAPEAISAITDSAFEGRKYSLLIIGDERVDTGRIAVNTRSMNVIKDEYYRQLAPDLPWDRFLRASHQQMSINRQSISMENLTREELSAVLDSCYEVFKAEEEGKQQSIRWLWPRYDMEFHCGYADLETTIKRLEELIDGTEEGRYDESGLYANIELPLYYAQYMRNNPQMQTDGDKLRYLDKAYRKMVRTLLSVPAEEFKEYFFFQVRTVISNFYEIEGSYTYLDLVRNIIRRFSGSYYVKGRMTGDIMKALCEELLAADGRYFDDIPFIAKTESEEKKKKAILDFAGECGLFLDFGSIKMNFRKIEDSRSFFEDDMEIYMLHTLSGYEDLKRRKSTEEFADIALGHHKWYDGNGGYPDSYVRTDSEYRLMTDVAAAAVHIVSEAKTKDLGIVLKEMTGSSHRQFSPIVLSCLEDEDLAKKIKETLEGDAVYYKEIYDELHAQ